MFAIPAREKPQWFLEDFFLSITTFSSPKPSKSRSDVLALWIQAHIPTISRDIMLSSQRKSFETHLDGVPHLENPKMFCLA